MPNHCENDLWISGPDDDVRVLLARIGADQDPPKFDFDAVIPYPEHFRVIDADARVFEREHGWKESRRLLREKYGTESDGYNSGGYEWCLANWGTKWGAYEVVRRDYGGICLTYQTAWGPSIQILVALQRIFPRVSLELEYFERGMGFCGGVSYRSESDTNLDSWSLGSPEGEWESKDYRGRRGG